MPKVKNATTKKSKKLVSTKRFSLRRSQVLAICLVLAVIGVAIVIKSFAGNASDLIGIYAYDSTNYYGPPQHTAGRKEVILHHGGGTERLTVGPYSGNKTGNSTLTFWAGSGGGQYNAVGTGRMWYGPQVNLPPTNNRKLHVCWYYVPPESQNANLTLDVTTNDGQRVLWSGGFTAYSELPISAYNPKTKQWSPPIFDMQQFCVPNDVIAVPPTGFKDLEIRAKLDSAGSGTTGAFHLWKTSWQIVGKQAVSV